MNAIDRTLNCKKILKICQLRNLIKCKLNIFSGDSRKSWLKEGGGRGKHCFRNWIFAFKLENDSR